MELAENVVVANRFRLLLLIGKGGMGSVWRAFDENLGTDCAIKFIEGDLAKRPEAQTRFKREAQAAAQLRSPNIVQIFDHNVWEGVPYCAMEFLEGEDLGKRLTRLKKIPHADLAYVMTEACRGLQKAHEKGIIHRDLKPDNIFLVKDDDREIVKVLDFGIAKLTDGGMDVSSGTKTGALLGTPQYMSPEQAQGTKAIDARSDLWSLAIIAYECITGELPLDSKALGDLLVKIIVTPMPVPSQIDPSVPPGFDAWFAKATSRDPQGRYQTARAFSDALAGSLGVAAPMGGRVASLAGLAGESGAYPPGPGSQGSILVGAASEGVLRPISVTMSGGEMAAGLPRKRSPGVLVGAAVLAALVMSAAVIGILSLRPKSTAAVSPAVADSAKAVAAETVSVPVIPGVQANIGGSGASSAASATGVTSAASATSATTSLLGLPVGGAAGAPPKTGGAKSMGTGGKPGGKPAGTRPGTKPDLGF